MNKKILIFGASGQDGQILTKMLCERGYEVFKSSKDSTDDFVCDITCRDSVDHIFDMVDPGIVFDLAAYTSVRGSFEHPGFTINTNAVGLSNMLDVLRDYPYTKLVHASSSEIFEPLTNEATRYTENSQISPATPYGVSKAAAYQLCQIYRKSYGLNISCGILFNHTSSYQTKDFLIPKIVDWIKSGGLKSGTKLKLGNLDSYRDFLSAFDVCNALYMMVGSNNNYIVSSGHSYKIHDIVTKIFRVAGVDDMWKYIEYDKNLTRPNQTNYSCGSSYKIYHDLGWIPTRNIDSIIKEMLNG